MENKPDNIISKMMDKFVASAEVADLRMKECVECPALIQITNTCSRCGCFMNVKVKLLTATCPIGKW